MVAPSLADKLRIRLRDQVVRKYASTPLSVEVLQAFDKNPRHLFVKRYLHPLSQRWVTFDAHADEAALEPLYADEPVLLYRGPEGWCSTLSQPSFVLRILDLLELKPGHVVFELGTASGWNAALMAYLVGGSGRVVSVEIVAELALMAQERLVRMGLSQVRVLLGDGARGFAPSAPYDRVILTAAAYDVPAALGEQLAEGGRMVFVMRGGSGFDTLYVLDKSHDVLRSRVAIPCAFVPVLGLGGAKPELLEAALATEKAVHAKGLRLVDLELEIAPRYSAGARSGAAAFESIRGDHVFRFFLPPGPSGQSEPGLDLPHAAFEPSAQALLVEIP